MRNSSFIVWVVLALVYQVYGRGHSCEPVLRCYEHVVNERMNDQIKVEMTGHYTYLYLSQIFQSHGNNYPKVAKYLRAKSSEELSHAERFIEYQNQRGGRVAMPILQRYQEGSCADVKDVMTAFKCAMELEAYVTRELTQLHSDVSDIKVTHGCSHNEIPSDDLRLTEPVLFTCSPTGGGDLITTSNLHACECRTISSVNYVEIAEMIAHEFLGHQVEDTKEIASHYRTLKKLQAANGEQGLGEYLFDKHLEL